MKTSRLSISSRISLWLTLSLIVLSSIALIVTAVLITSKTDKIFDRSLLAAAHSIQQQLSVKNGKYQLRMPYFMLDVMGGASGEKVYYRIERSDGEILAGFKGLAKPKHRDTNEAVFYHTNFAGNELRAVHLSVVEKQFGAKAYTHIIVAESADNREQFTYDILFILVGMSIAAVILAIIASLIGVRLGLSPIRKIGNALQKRSALDLSPLSEPVPKEIRGLVKNINQLMSRLTEGIGHIQHFNADVSHQLRTPLAEIKVLVQLAQTKPEKIAVHQALGKIEDQVDFLSHTTQQLLNYAKTQQHVLQEKHRKPIDLVNLCREVALKYTPKIYRRGQEIKFQAIGNEGAKVLGDPIMLEGLVSNLLENAYLYSVDKDNKPFGLITLSIQVSDSAKIIIQDQGPGINEDEIDKVRDRFYRGSSQQNGSGLGLAIVQQVCDFHQGCMTLENVSPKGLKASVTLSII